MLFFFNKNYLLDLSYGCPNAFGASDVFAIFLINFVKNLATGFENRIIMTNVNKYGNIINMGWIELPLLNKLVACCPKANKIANKIEINEESNVFHLLIKTIAIAKNPKPSTVTWDLKADPEENSEI